MSYAPPPAYQPPASLSQGEPPLNQPYYGAPFSVAVRRYVAKYATFSGRASRSEYWWWQLVAAVVGIVYSILNSALRGAHAGPTNVYFTSPGQSVVEILYFIWALANIVPSLALAWRRLHDTNRSGAWYFIALIPIVGGIILLVWFCSADKGEGRRFDR
ncbi:hypothetical protein AX769_16565 [Frondihabitans sp. PAMC 28766]|uniref:DUF805 domain-containing protein n=1 Tax=Frondihabitans sp. PAMC 28766 TaxID=1795630 RepID=UPI00078E9FEC|nr:DUF805 domain-containing protein [Frondihabitans sp. PAMC 28766]AMM21450.1 hypothetical protein AX769_16565 [Frondihabitans sp. PAMC 28766]